MVYKGFTRDDIQDNLRLIEAYMNAFGTLTNLLYEEMGADITDEDTRNQLMSQCNHAAGEINYLYEDTLIRLLTNHGLKKDLRSRLDNLHNDFETKKDELTKRYEEYRDIHNSCTLMEYEANGISKPTLNLLQQISKEGAWLPDCIVLENDDTNEEDDKD